MRCSAFIAASVDGFIARPDGGLDWLHKEAYAVPDGGDFGYGEFTDSVDVLVMGSGTFKKVLSFDEWPYGETPVVVLSRRDLGVPNQLRGKVRVENLAPGELVAQLEHEGARHLYIDGGKTLKGFLQAGLLHEITITQIPVLLGDGIPLFGSIGVELSLRHLRTRSYSNGFVQTTYEMVYAT